MEEVPHRVRNCSPSFASPRRSYRRLAPPSAQHLHEHACQSVSSNGSEKGWLRMINARRTPERCVVRGFRNGVSHATISALAAMRLSQSESALCHDWMEGENSVAGASQTRPGQRALGRARRRAQISFYVPLLALSPAFCTPRTPVTTVDSTRIGII
jgi:hypothetical protein